MKAKQIKKTIRKPKKDAYKPIKISGAFSDKKRWKKKDSKKDESIARYLNIIREHLKNW